MLEQTPSAIEVIYDDDQGVILRLVGEFDVFSEKMLLEQLDGILEKPKRTLRIDLSEATFVGVGVLTRVVHAAQDFQFAQFGSSLPIVKKLLRLFEFVDDSGRVLRPTLDSSSDDDVREGVGP